MKRAEQLRVRVLGPVVASCTGTRHAAEIAGHVHDLDASGQKLRRNLCADLVGQAQERHVATCRGRCRSEILEAQGRTPRQRRMSGPERLSDIVNAGHPRTSSTSGCRSSRRMSSAPPYPLPPITEALKRSHVSTNLSANEARPPPARRRRSGLSSCHRCRCGCDGDGVGGRTDGDSSGHSYARSVCTAGARGACTRTRGRHASRARHSQRTDHADRGHPAGHGGRGAHRVQRHQARTVQGPGRLGGAELPAQAGRHPGARRRIPGSSSRASPPA